MRLFRSRSFASSPTYTVSQEEYEALRKANERARFKAALKRTGQDRTVLQVGNYVTPQDRREIYAAMYRLDSDRPIVIEPLDVKQLDPKRIPLMCIDQGFLSDVNAAIQILQRNHPRLGMFLNSDDYDRYMIMGVEHR